VGEAAARSERCVLLSSRRGVTEPVCAALAPKQTRRSDWPGAGLPRRHGEDFEVRLKSCLGNCVKGQAASDTP